MELLDGKLVSKQIKEELKIEVEGLVAKFGVAPTLAIVLVGNVEASQIYVRNKLKAAKLTGINTNLVTLPDTITTEELLKVVNELNADEAIDGIIVQLPLPKQVDEAAVINAIQTDKDVDGFGISNKGRLFCGMDAVKSATPFGIMKLLEAYHIDLTGKSAVVVGRSNIVGKPMAMMLLQENATVTICHSRTKDLGSVTRGADVLVVAIGKAKFIKADMVKDSAVVVDVGMNRDESGLCGDVDFENVAPKCSYITPVPGGVGPLTIAMLLYNTVSAFKKRHA